MLMMYIQSVTTGKIFRVLQSAGENQLKSGKFTRVDDARVERINASLA